MFLGIASQAQTVIFEEDFESYDDFEYENVGDWTLVDVDGYRDETGFALVTFPNQNEMTSFIVFNPNNTTPPMADNGAMFNWDFSAKSGEKYMLTKFMTSGANDDWLISPQIEIPNGSGMKLNFSVKAPSGHIFNETFRVLISTTDKELESFDLLDEQTMTVGKEWVEMEYDLDEYQRESIYVAIQYVSNGIFALLIDDFKVSAETLGVTDHAKPEIAVFPNPTKGDFSISIPSHFNKESMNIAIYDMTGRLVKSVNPDHVSIQDVSNGVYFVEISDGKNKSKAKLIKN